jgi:hypothetical protein
MSPDQRLIPESDPLELATDRVIAACDGDVRAAVRALIVAKGLLAAELNDVCAMTSNRYSRGRIKRTGNLWCGVAAKIVSQSIDRGPDGMNLTFGGRALSQDRQDGIFAGSDDVVGRVTGKPPMTVQEFVASHIDLLQAASPGRHGHATRVSSQWRRRRVCVHANSSSSQKNFADAASDYGGSTTKPRGGVPSNGAPLRTKLRNLMWLRLSCNSKSTLVYDRGCSNRPNSIVNG